MENKKASPWSLNIEETQVCLLVLDRDVSSTMLKMQRNKAEPLRETFLTAISFTIAVLEF